MAKITVTCNNCGAADTTENAECANTWWDMHNCPTARPAQQCVTGTPPAAPTPLDVIAAVFEDSPSWQHARDLARNVLDALAEAGYQSPAILAAHPGEADTEWGVKGTPEQGIEAAPSEVDARLAVDFLKSQCDVAELVSRQVTPWECAK